MTSDFYEIAGWLGVVFILGAFFLNSRGILRSTGKPYLTMNLLGAVAMGIQVFHKGSSSGTALQAVWAVIAIYSIIRPPKPKAVEDKAPKK